MDHEGQAPMGGMEEMDTTGMAPDAQAELTLRVHGGGAHTGIAPSGFEGIDTHVLDALPRARLSDEEKLMREVSRRRQMELDRRARIFDAKRRTIGVDKEVLDQQCVENAQRRAAEAEKNRREGLEHLKCQQQLKLMEKEKAAMQRTMEKECKDYSLQNLHYAARSEFDLNDPKAITKGAPARVGDTDPRCGPASMQQFNGEDLMREERVRQQRLATVDFIEQQKFEKEMLKRQNAGEDGKYAQQTKEITTLRDQVEEREVALRRELMLENQNELLACIAQNQKKKQEKAQYDQDMNARELNHHSSDTFLNENGTAHHNGRVVRDAYKGSTRDERIQVRDMQREQAEATAQQKASEGGQDFAFNYHTELSRKQLVMMEREKARMKRSLAAENARQNQMLAQQQRDNKAALDVAYRNNFAPEFFDQFGVGTR